MHELRYAVYCKEKAFLDAKKYPDRKEYDRFDEYSVHFTAVDRKNEIAGTARLVIPNENQSFPFEAFCKPLPGSVLPPKGKAAEVSRLIIAPNFRVRPDDREFGFSLVLSKLSKFVGGSSSSGRPADNTLEFTRVAPMAHENTSPRILLGLFRKMYRYSKQNGITHWYAAMERTLDRMLLRYHFSFHRISDPVDYYGPVSLYMASIEELELMLGKHNPELLTWFKKSRSPVPPTNLDTRDVVSV